MLPEKLIVWFLPRNVRDNKTHASFYEMYNVASANLVGCVGMSIIPLILFYFNAGTHLWTYYLNVFTFVITLFTLRYSGYWRVPTFFCGLVAYYILYTWLVNTGLIYSINITMVHINLIAALIVDKRWGWLNTFNNLIFLGIIYHLTTTTPVMGLSATLGNPFYALLMHALITVFLGGFLAYALHSQEFSRKRIKALQDQKISLLDEAVRMRTEQLSNIRKTIATDFHDQTGNMLAAINRQAAMLQLKLHEQHDLLPLVESIITNSDDLYASSKDFLWNLNHDSDNPHTLFNYLTGYGQNFYNQFDIAFSANIIGTQETTQQLDPFASLNLIYIFKEAMSNIIKHSLADDVVMSMTYGLGVIVYAISDNGQWKEADPGIVHYGLNNMERRCKQSGFGYKLTHDHTGTTIAISVSVNAYFMKKEVL